MLVVFAYREGSLEPFTPRRRIMTPLRQRLVDDLKLRNYSPRTIEAYVAGVAKFAKHFGRSPDQLGPDELRAFQLHLLAAGTSWSLFNQSIVSLRFIFDSTLGI